MSRTVLGVTISVHDSSACLVRDGKLVAAVEEERLVRRKHTGEFPLKSIEYCLASQGMTIGDVDCVAYTQVPWKAIPSKIGYTLARLPHSTSFLARELYWYLLNYAHVRTWPERVTPRRADQPPKRLEHLFLEHHLTHATSAYYPSPFEEAALCSIDQRGEWASTFFATARQNRITPISEIHYPDSLGLFYLMITLFLGFRYHEEYEVMGLAAYGKPRYVDEMAQIARYTGDLRFELDERFVASSWKRLYTDDLIRLLGPARGYDEPFTERHYDIAASLQAQTERIVLALLRDLHRRTRLPRLCLAGGVALNSVMNGKILTETPFTELFIQPAAHDAGGSIGAAMHAAHSIHPNGSQRQPMDHVYLGPEFSADEIRALLDSSRLAYSEPADLESEIAKRLSEGKVVGWFQGRMEFGPRALGNRSILADPRTRAMQDRVNLMVKERQSFRPFAPAILEEKVGEYVSGIQSSPYMLLVGRVTEKAKAAMPAVVHVDGTARVQTVSRRANPRFWTLINRFEQFTGVPVLLNTSFNLRGEPIVCSPRDAIRTFFTSGLDLLVLDRFVLAKPK